MSVIPFVSSYRETTRDDLHFLVAFEKKH